MLRSEQRAPFRVPMGEFEWKCVHGVAASQVLCGQGRYGDCGVEARLRGSVSIVDTSGCLVAAGELCQLGSEVKPVFADDAFTVVCEWREGVLCPCAKAELDGIGDSDEGFSCVCDQFEWDNDNEECEGVRASCRNCLSRRWVAYGFECVKGK